MPDLSRQVARAARDWADQQNDALAGIPPGTYVASVSSTAPLQVSWRGRTLGAYGCAAYTPTVGDRVLFALTSDQLIVIDKIV